MKKITYALALLFSLSLTIDSFARQDFVPVESIRVTKIFPEMGTRGTTVSIHGVGFDGAGNTVDFVPAIEDRAPTEVAVTATFPNKLEVMVPEGMRGGNYYIRVTKGSDGVSSMIRNQFTVITGGGNFEEIDPYGRIIDGNYAYEDDNVTVGDITDNNGYLDFILAYDSGFRDVTFGDGSGDYEYSYSTIHSGSSDAAGLLTDINGDQIVDFVSAGSGMVKWNETSYAPNSNSDGRGSHLSFTNHSIGSGNFHSVSAADINNDGFVDVVIGGSGYLDWYDVKNGNVKTQISSSETQVVKTVDLDGDGDMDILAARGYGNPTVVWYENDESQNFTEHEIYRWTYDPELTGSEAIRSLDLDAEEVSGDEFIRGVDVVDMDGDGDLDFMVNYQGVSYLPDNYFVWHENDGNENFTAQEPITFNQGGVIYFSKAVDFDADGDIDVLAMEDTNEKLFLIENKGETHAAHLISDKVVSAQPGIADMDSDGDIDIVATTDIPNYEYAPEKDVRVFENISSVSQIVTAPGGKSLTINAGKIEAPHHAVYNDLEALTVEAWIFPRDSKRMGIVEKHESPSSGFWIDFNSDISAQVVTENGSTSGSSGIDPALNKWHHVAVAYDGTEVSVYLNGNDVTGERTGSGSGTITNNTRDLIIGDLNWSSANFDGQIDEVRIWNKALTEEEIRQHMYQQLGGDEEGLIAYYPLDEIDGERALDSTSHENHGLLNTSVLLYRGIQSRLNTGILQTDDTHPYGTIITGTEGWRMMSVPVEGATYGEILDTLWTQGFPGSDSPDYGASNVLVWEESVGSFVSISNASDIPATGSGFITYVYEDEDFDGTPNNFPKIIRSDSGQVSGGVTPTLSFTDSGTLANDGWNLLGNPYGATIDWDATGWTTSNLDASFYLWNADAGQYQSWNGATGTLSSEGLIAPWQGFWVKANAADPQITFSDDIRSAGGILRKEQATPQLRFTLSDGEQSNEAVVMFSQESAIDKDPMDAYKLASLNGTYLSLFTELEDGSALDINALPAKLEAPVSIPLNMDGSDLSGAFELSWATEALPEGWTFMLTDHTTGEKIDLREQSALSFQLSASKSTTTQSAEASEGGKEKLNPVHQVLSPKVMKTASESTARFTLTITSAQAVTNERLADIPTSVELQQNYPNPFNPTTTIEYGVPEAAEVTLEVFDMLGRKVATLVNRQMQQASRYSVQFDAGRLSSGMYIYRMKAGNTVITKKLTLIK